MEVYERTAISSRSVNLLGHTRIETTQFYAKATLEGLVSPRSTFPTIS